MVIHPAPGDKGHREASSYVSIGRHLRQASVPVPEIYDFDPVAGIITVEDLGDISLQAEIKRLAGLGACDRIAGLYRSALLALARMQVVGGRLFDPSWSYDTPRYDSRLAFQKEAKYFLGSFVWGMMGLEWTFGLEEELRHFSMKIDAMHWADFFLHRDFQSRNILVQPGDILRIIDFQGGRMGPLGYDAGSLLFDPYTSLPFDLIDGLFGDYVDMLHGFGLELERNGFWADFKILSLFRLLQALGAYSFLSVIKGKDFFKTYIPVAVASLNALLDDGIFDEVNALRRLVKKISDCKMKLLSL
ncbi:MAG: phosphotransferase [Desulfobacteraceae bacterium]|nr:phosphotransferase [Desulfobacteraceae bacterium]